MMHRPIRFPYWFIIILLAAFAVGYLAWSESMNYESGIMNYGSLSTRQPAADSLETTGVLAGWQIYRNEEYGFEVRYPGHWKVRQENYDYTQKPYIGEETRIFLRPSWGDSFVGIYPAELLDYAEPANALKVYNGLFGEIKAKIHELEGGKVIEILESKPNWALGYNRIEINYGQHEPTINHILSTFKFIE